MGAAASGYDAIDSDRRFRYACRDLQNRARETGPALFATLFPSFEKGVMRIDSDDSGFDFCRPVISDNRVIGHRHNLGTFHNFGASAPEPNPQKTGAAHSSATSSEAAAAFNLNGQSLG
jgi:hypothetical protein